MNRDTVFISFSHSDERWRQRVVDHLKVLVAEGHIHLWDDSRIGAGENWHARINGELNRASVALLLVSAPFLTSDFVRHSEIPTILERHQQDGLIVYPLLIRPCPWQEVGWLKRLQVRPRGGKPLASYQGAKIDEILADVSREIAAVIRSTKRPQQDEGPPDVLNSHARALTTPTDAGSEVGERILKVRVHRAYFVGRPEECYFVNLTNLSPRRVLEVTHVWYEDEVHHIPINQAVRHLPTRLDLDESWETWIETAALPPAFRGRAFEMFRARTSDGSVFRSEMNTDVPGQGFVPGGSGGSS